MDGPPSPRDSGFHFKYACISVLHIFVAYYAYIHEHRLERQYVAVTSQQTNSNSTNSYNKKQHTSRGIITHTIRRRSRASPDLARPRPT